MTDPVLSVRSPGELVALVPYQLGFHPSDSHVIIGLSGQGGRVVGVCRFDHLPELSGPLSGSAHRPDLGRAEQSDAPSGDCTVVLQTAQALRRAGVGSAIVLSFDETTTTTTSGFQVVASGLVECGIAVLFEAVVRDGYGWVRPDAASPGQGFVVPEASRVAAVAHYVGSGVAPLAGRADVALLVGEDAALASPVASALTRSAAAGVGPTRRASSWGRIATVDSYRGSDAVEVAAMALSLTDHDWRDGLMTSFCPGALPVDLLAEATRRALRRAFPPARAQVGPQEVLQRLCGLCRQMPDSGGAVSAEVLALTAAVAWHLGEGALAGDACQRALRLDPTHRLAGLLERVLCAGLQPPETGEPERPQVASPGRSRAVPSEPMSEESA